MVITSLSHVVRFVLHIPRNNSLVEHLRAKLGAFLRVLQDSRNFDRARPVDVVEALTEDQLLKQALLHLAITVYHAVVVWNSGASSCLLAYQEEVVEVGYHSFADQCPCRYVPESSILREEPFAILNIYHDCGQCDQTGLFRVRLLQLFGEPSEVMFVVYGYLIPCARIQEDEYLFWQSSVSFVVGGDAIAGELHHRQELAVGLGELLEMCVQAGVGGIDGGCCCQVDRGA